MQHIEEAGIHSGDSACCLPPVSIKPYLINDSKVKDFSALHKYLFDEVDSYATGHIASVILILAESQYQDAFAVDKELHIKS